MEKVKFSTLAVGDQFIFNGKTFSKIQQKKVSCCKVLNAVNLENNEKVMLRPIDIVEKVESTSDNK